MSRLLFTGFLALLALAAGMQALGEISAALDDPTLRSWAVVGYSLLKTGVVAAFSVFVLVRQPSRRPSRDPLAFAACAAAIVAVLVLQRPSDSAATALVLAGELMTLISCGWLLVSVLALGRCFGVLPEVRGLVTHGPYRLIRHPVYLGELGACAGLVLASPTVWNLGVAAVFGLAQSTRMRLEERALLDEFSEYADYAARTPRLVPRPGGPAFMRRVPGAALVVALAAAGLVAASATGAQARLSTPIPLSPAAGSAVALLPAFAWNPVPRADRYEFQIAADAGFNAPVLGSGQDRFFTKSTRATLKKTVPNGTYWWRVRAAGKGGNVSPWSNGRSLRKAWTAAATLQAPGNGAAVDYPLTPLKLSWAPVTGAAKYLVSIATDPELGSLVGGTAVETAATSFTRTGALTPGTYYWGITPVDAEGNKGARSEVRSFVWRWPSAMTAGFSDLVAETEVVDPQFSWAPVPGAARYEVEVNSSSDFAPGSRVCCSTLVIGASLSPTSVFRDNTYYWRVRAFDPDGNAGIWNEGAQFVKTFDKAPPVPAPSIKHVRMRDNLNDPGTDVSSDPGYQTRVPVVRWDPVPGASSYEVEVTPFDFGFGFCNWSSNLRWQVKTAVTAWSPLGHGLTASPPYGNPSSVARDLVSLDLDQRYCMRVRARSDRDSSFNEVYGDYTELDNQDGTGWAFQWVGYPAGGSCTPSCNSGYLGAGDYVVPSAGSTVRQTPLLTWRPLAGRASYFVIVAKDPSFTNLVDYAFTQVPAYAPRTGTAPTTYPDETTSYYWVVLPAVQEDGDGAVGNPLLGAPSRFDKQSNPPSRLGPQDGSVILGYPTFRWTLALGARRYRLQVSQDPTFGDPIDNILTDATSYTSNTAYPADTALYWRVRADDEKLIGLTWSSTGTFQKRLSAPAPSAANPSGGDFIPTWTWDSITGASSYDVAVDLPNGSHRDITGLRTAALTPIIMYGTGLFHWKVRANFPKAVFGSVPGPYSGTLPFTRTIGEPSGARSDASRRHVLLSWEPKPGVKRYRVQIASQQDFARLVEDVTTDNTSYAPLLTQPAYLKSNPLSFFWRVAGVDEGNNIGDFTPVQQIGTANRLRLAARGKLVRRRSTAVSLIVTSSSGAPVKAATVRVSGAGLRPRAARTNRLGRVRFVIYPRRLGTITYRATKAGYEPAVLKTRVR